MSRHLIQGAASWAARMEMRIKSMEELRAYDRALLERRNQAVYAAEIPPELSSLGSWLDEKTIAPRKRKPPPLSAKRACM
jgi:hypothetical protein